MDWDADDARYMATGLDAFYCGVEVSLFQRVGKWLEANAFASIGNWRWMKDVSAGILQRLLGFRKNVLVRCPCLDLIVDYLPKKC